MHRFIAVTLTVLAWGTAGAHERWFIDAHPYPLNLQSAFTMPNIWFVAAAVMLTLLAYLLWRVRRGQGFLPGPAFFGAPPERRSALYGLIPAILGVHLAVPLLVSGVTGTLFAPHVELFGAWRYLLGLAQTGIALSLFYGGLTRFAAAALAALWLLGWWVTAPALMLENIHILGFAIFFYCAGRGPVAIDRLIFPRFEPPASLLLRAVPALRMGVGASLIVVAFTEKLASLPLALAFLDDYPLNFLPMFGLPLANSQFILAAGAVELTVGLLILFNIFVRETIVIAWLPFNLTLTIFNWVELVGHLPFYGAMAVLLVWTSGSLNQTLWVHGLQDGPLPAVPALSEREVAAAGRHEATPHQ